MRRKENYTEGTLSVSLCSDILLLSPLFLELAEDEESDVHRTDQKASEEMADFLKRGEKAYIFVVTGNVVGYALVNINRKPAYLHHFYVCRSERRKGYGTCAFKALLETLKINEMDLDVYNWNERGKAFWESLGFKPRAIIMRYGK